jgi:hypothetical protein
MVDSTDLMNAVASLLQVYASTDKIDVAVGLLAETPLPGWIFGE